MDRLFAQADAGVVGVRFRVGEIAEVPLDVECCVFLDHFSLLAQASAGSRDVVPHPIVALFFELQGQILAAAELDPAAHHDVHVIGHDVVEQPLVMGDQEHAEIRPAQRVDAVRDDFERVDVEAAVGLVEHGVFRLEHRHLQNFVALLLAAGEAFIHRARGERAIHLEQIHLLVELRVVIGRLEFLALRQTGLDRGAEEIGDRHAGDFARVLEGQEKASPRALVRLQFENIFAVHQHRSRGHDVIRMAGQHLGERALAGAVWPHDGVHFALGNGEAETADDLLFGDRNV